MNETRETISGQGYLPKSKKKRLWIPVLLGVIAVAALVIASGIGFIKYREAKIFGEMSPETRAGFESWYTEKLSIPAEDLVLEPFTSQTLAAVTDFKDQWKTNNPAVKAFENAWKPGSTGVKEDGSGASSEVFSPELLQELAPHVAEAKSLLDAFQAVIHRPDYTMASWNADLWTSDSVSIYHAVRTCSRMIQVEALMLPSQDGAAAAESLFVAARLDTYPPAILKMISMTLVDRGIATYNMILEKSDDAAVRSQVADIFERNRPIVVVMTQSALDPLVEDNIGLTAPVRRAGVLVNFNGKTGQEISREAWRGWYSFLMKPENSAGFSLKEIQEFRKAAEMIEDQIQTSGTNRYPFSERLDRLSAGAIYSMSGRALSEMSDKFNQILARYDAVKP